MLCDAIHNSTWRALPSSRNFWKTSLITSCSRQIRIEAETDVPIPGVADRDRDPQLAAPRLRSCRLVHSGSDDAQLELADAALHAEQQAIVRAARIVDAVEIDDAGLDQPAQLEQMMPVAAIAREPRGIEAEHRADLAGAQRGDQAIEAGPLDGAARRCGRDRRR